MNFSETNRLATIHYSDLYDDLRTIKSANPGSYILIDNIYLTVYEPFKVTTEWTLQDTLLDPTLFTFFVERSGSPSGPFERLHATGLKDIYTYTDDAAPNFSKQNILFYRIAILRDAANEIYYSVAADYRNKPDYVALEIAWRNKLLLARVVGVPCVVYKRKHWGMRCRECWDVELKRRVKAKCLTCYDTGYEGGYWSPVPAMVNFSPSPSIVMQTPWGKAEPYATTAWMGNFPPVEPQDVIVEEGGNKRWIIKKTDNKEKKRFVVKQIIQIEALDKGRVEYDLQ